MSLTSWYRTNMAGLNAEDARIFRITHVNNVPWLLANGLHCKSSNRSDPDFVPIGSQELIIKRSNHLVACGPRGTLADYVPFYFTPYSIMLYNISTGYQGVPKQPNESIVILVCSIPKLVELDKRFVFYDGHAYMFESTCYTSPADLDKIDWKILQARDFKNDPDDPGKKGRYQAEALVHRHLPASALQGIGCYDSACTEQVANLVADQGLQTPVKALPSWYF